MTKTEMLNAPVRPLPKREAEKALAKLELTPDAAIAKFYQQTAQEYAVWGKTRLEVPPVSCCRCRGKTPTSESIAAIPELAEGIRVHFMDFACTGARPDILEGNAQCR